MFPARAQASERVPHSVPARFPGFAVVCWQHRLDLRIFVGHPAQHDKRRILLHLHSHSLGLLAHFRQGLHHAFSERRLVKLNQPLNIFHRKILRIDRHHRIGHGTWRSACIKLSGKCVHEFLHFAGADGSPCYLLYLVRNIVLDVLAHVGDFGDVHKVTDRRVFGGVELCCGVGRLRACGSGCICLRGWCRLCSHSRLMLLGHFLCIGYPDCASAGFAAKIVVAKVKTSGAMRNFIFNPPFFRARTRVLPRTEVAICLLAIVSNAPVGCNLGSTRLVLERLRCL